MLNHDLVVIHVRPFADHDHAIVVEDDHFSSVSFLQDGGV
jgi:hypothetical protein